MDGVVVVVVVGRGVCKREAGEGAGGAKNPKLRRLGSISGAPSEVGVGSSGGRWCDGADEVVVVVGRGVRKREAGEGTEGQKSRNRAIVARFRAALGLQEVERGSVALQCPLPW